MFLQAVPSNTLPFGSGIGILTGPQANSDLLLKKLGHCLEEALDGGLEKLVDVIGCPFRLILLNVVASL